MSSQILVVNNQPQMSELISEKLIQAGHRVTTPVDSYVAIELLSGTGFDLIILDDQMQLMTADGFLDVLSEEGITAPVILLSGSPDTKVDVNSPGISGILRKPFPMDLLISKAGDLLK